MQSDGFCRLPGPGLCKWGSLGLLRPLSPASALLFGVASPPCTIQAVHAGLTSLEKPPLTKVLSLLYWVYSRVNKITHLQPNETGAAVGHQAPGSRADHTPPGTPFCSPGTAHWTPAMVHSRGVIVQRTGVRKSGPCPGSARHACDLGEVPSTPSSYVTPDEPLAGWNPATSPVGGIVSLSKEANELHRDSSISVNSKQDQCFSPRTASSFLPVTTRRLLLVYWMVPKSFMPQ